MPPGDGREAPGQGPPHPRDLPGAWRCAGCQETHSQELPLHPLRKAPLSSWARCPGGWVTLKRPRHLPANVLAPGCEKGKGTNSLRFWKSPENITRSRLQIPRNPAMGDQAALTPLNPFALVIGCPLRSRAAPATLGAAMELVFSTALYTCNSGAGNNHEAEVWSGVRRARQPALGFADAQRSPKGG